MPPNNYIARRPVPESAVVVQVQRSPRREYFPSALSLFRSLPQKLPIRRRRPAGRNRPPTLPLTRIAITFIDISAAAVRHRATEAPSLSISSGGACAVRTSRAARAQR